VALVGYTNAGKSTWFNRLSRAHVRVADQLFATLDPTIRAVRLPTGERVGLSDTVGFISDLPTQLVAAFRATLEEVLAADVLVHVRDIASPATEAQAADVESVLADLGIDASEQERRVVELWNKADRLDDQGRADAEARLPRGRAVLGSARTGEGEAALLQLIADRLGRFRTRLRLEVPVADGEAVARAYRLGAVVARHDDERVVTLDLDVPAANVERLRDFAHDRGLDLDVAPRRAAE
jgi:GTP-binding protein HflX